MDNGGESPVMGRFFKVLVPGFETRLKLAPALIKSLKNVDLKMKRGVLKSCKGTWEVDVKKYSDGLLHFLGESWKDYVNDHDMKIGEFIVFEHMGHLIFNTFVFDETSCHKDFVDMENDEQEDNNDEDDLKHIEGEEKVRDSRNVNFQFQKTLKKWHLGGFCVPTEIGRLNGWERKGSVTLRTTTGNSWLARIHIYNIGNHKRIYISGLTEFLRENKLKVGDTCIFKPSHHQRNQRHVVMDVLYVKR